MKRQRFTKTEAIAVTALVLVALTLVLLISQRHDRISFQGHNNGCSSSGMTLCHSGLKQLGNASALYACDNSGAYPGPVPSTVLPVWDIALGTKMGIPNSPAVWAGGTDCDKSLAVFVCPSVGEAWSPAKKHLGVCWHEFNWGVCQDYGPVIPFQRSYSMNLGDNEIAVMADKVLASAIASPSGTVQLCELHDPRNLLGKPVLAALSRKEFVEELYGGKKSTYHRCKGPPSPLTLFYDGHVEITAEPSVREGEVFRYKKPSMITGSSTAPVKKENP